MRPPQPRTVESLGTESQRFAHRLVCHVVRAPRASASSKVRNHRLQYTRMAGLQEGGYRRFKLPADKGLPIEAGLEVFRIDVNGSLNAPELTNLAFLNKDTSIENRYC